MNSVLKSVLSGIVLALGISTVAFAQASGGNIIGEASAGQTIVVDGADSGLHREIKIKQDGKYTIRRVPTGDYVVEVLDKDGNTTQKQVITVRIGSTARVQ